MPSPAYLCAIWEAFNADTRRFIDVSKYDVSELPISPVSPTKHPK